MSDESPLKSGMNKLMTYSFTLLAAAIMLTWAWGLLRPLVPIIVVAVVWGLAVVAIVRHVVNRDGRW